MWNYPLIRSQQSNAIGLNPLHKLMRVKNNVTIRGVVESKTFQAISYDIYGSFGALHETLKQPIAKRLAVAAVNVVYKVLFTS